MEMKNTRIEVVICAEQTINHGNVGMQIVSYARFYKKDPFPIVVYRLRDVENGRKQIIYESMTNLIKL